LNPQCTFPVPLYDPGPPLAKTMLVLNGTSMAQLRGKAHRYMKAEG